MLDSMFLIAVDVGTMVMKTVLIQRDLTGRQWLLERRIESTALLEESLPAVIEDLEAVIANQAIPAEGNRQYDLVLVGHPPDLDLYGRAAKVARYSHAEALLAIGQRLSAEGGAVVVDIGSHRTMVAIGRYGKVEVESWDFGVGEQAWDFLRHGTTSQQLAAWLPFDIPDDAIVNYVANKNLYPHIVPTTTVEIAIEQALAKMMLRQVAEAVTIPWSEVSQVVLTGAVLSQTIHDPQSVAMYLDGLQPEGSNQMLLDSNLDVMALGGVCLEWSAKDYSIGRGLLRSVLLPVAQVVSLSSPKGDESRQRLAKITLDSGLSTEQTIEVRAGEVAVIPWRDGEVGQMKIKGGGAELVKDDQPLAGGSVGLVIDGRVRPILLADNERERRAQLLRWDKQLNVHRQIGTFEQAIAKAEVQDGQ